MSTFIPPEEWQGPPNKLPSYFYRESEARDKDHLYQYVGNSTFYCEAKGEYWKWTPATRSPACPEKFEKTDKLPASTAIEVFWPYYVQWIERTQKFPGIVLDSLSIRNFECADKGRALIGVLNLMYAANNLDCKIFLSPLVDRNIKTDSPDSYRTSRSDTTRRPSSYNGKEKPLIGGRFLEFIQDTRDVGLLEKNNRKNASKQEREQSQLMFSEAHKAIHLALVKKKGEGGMDIIPVIPPLKRPTTVTGSSHDQLRSALTDLKLSCMGFTVTKLSVASASFSDTSGTLNHAHFGTLSIGEHWKSKIMEAIAQGLRVSVKDSKGISPDIKLDPIGRPAEPHQKGAY